MSKKPFSGGFSPRNYPAKFQQWRTVVGRQELDKFTRKMAITGLRIMKKHTPVRTGRLRNSVKIFAQETKGGQIDLRSRIGIGSVLPYFSYVDKGTKQSDGRYVPVLGRRISTGLHPGVRARNFVDKANKEISMKIPNEFEKYLKKWGDKL